MKLLCFSLITSLFLSTALGAKVQYHKGNVALATENTPCLPGWVKNASTGKCDDINECTQNGNGTHTCLQGNACKNTPGSFQCLCGKGYVGTIPACHDIDECKIGNHTCWNAKNGVGCNNTKGSFQCACNKGWENIYFVGANNTPFCRNQNECTSNTSSCHANATCSDTHGSFACTCNDGWKGNGTHCYDVNECDNNRCHWKHGSICNNTVGSYTCNCRDGFEDDGNGKCRNLNECANSTHNCAANASCTDTDGSFWCRCNAGWIGDGVNCTDDNECARPNPCAHVNPLQHASECNNTEGSFQCVCKPGWEADANETCLNVNECTSNTTNHTCEADASTCVDTQGSFFCSCNRGYRTNLTTHKCDDINECNTTMHGCFGQGQGCNNTNGSWACMCKPGYEATNTTSGWTNNSVNCTDVDECTAGTHNCNSDGKCTDAYGSFSCECNNGYIGDGVTCEAYDACLFKHDDCDKNAFCNSTSGSFTCTCNTGFTGNGTNCSDLNECGILPNGTDLGNGTDTCNNDTGVCTNTFGSFICNCKEGYLGNGVDCLNINECEAGLFACPGNSSCSDTNGSYTCVANTGYRFVNVSYSIAAPTSLLSVKSHAESHSYSNSNQAPSVGIVIRQVARDIDECAENVVARTANASVALLCQNNTATCNNTQGSYECICKAGWARNITGDGTDCADIDECKVGLAKCSPHAYCVNTDGNYTCGCKQGYRGNGFVCEDIDECGDALKAAAANATNNRSMCSQGAFCNNTVGSFACNCHAGYFGDGSNCLNKDECTLKTHNCLEDWFCTDTIGSFTCVCPTGYGNMDKKANGTMCWSNKTFEVGQIIKKGLGWQTIKFYSPFFFKPVVIVSVPIAAGDRQVVARVRNVNTKTFQVAVGFEATSNATDDEAFDKWLNASLPPLNFIAASVGNYTLPDGTIVNAGVQSTSGENPRSTPCSKSPEAQRYWDTATFGRNLSSNPVILASFQSVDDKLFKGGADVNLCEPGLRFDPAKNNSIQVTRICHSYAAGPYLGKEWVGWIAIGSNESNETARNTSFPLNNKRVAISNISYAMVDTMSSNFTEFYGNTTNISTQTDITYGSTFDSPIAFVSKVSLDLNVVGFINLEGALSDKAVVRVKDDKCPLPQQRKEYFTAFVASETFSV